MTVLVLLVLFKTYITKLFSEPSDITSIQTISLVKHRHLTSLAISHHVEVAPCFKECLHLVSQSVYICNHI